MKKKITTELLQGRYNNQYKILECFKTDNITSIMGGMENDIVKAELKEEEPSEDKNIHDFFKTSIQATHNSKLFTSLLGAIEKDFSDTVQKKIDDLNRIYFLPTTRGRNSEWFID